MSIETRGKNLFLVTDGSVSFSDVLEMKNEMKIKRQRLYLYLYLYYLL